MYFAFSLFPWRAKEPTVFDRSSVALLLNIVSSSGINFFLQKLSTVQRKHRTRFLFPLICFSECEGGYDERVAENVEHLEELKTCARAEGLEDLVEFRTNIADGA